MHRIVLLGDSHAGQWFSTLLAVASQRHWALEELAKQGCPLPRLTVSNPQLGRTYTEFPAGTDSVEKFLDCLREGRCAGQQGSAGEG